MYVQLTSDQLDGMCLAAKRRKKRHLDDEFTIYLPAEILEEAISSNIDQFNSPAVCVLFDDCDVLRTKCVNTNYSNWIHVYIICRVSVAFPWPNQPMMSSMSRVYRYTSGACYLAQLYHWYWLWQLLLVVWWSIKEKLGMYRMPSRMTIRQAVIHERHAILWYTTMHTNLYDGHPLWVDMVTYSDRSLMVYLTVNKV